MVMVCAASSGALTEIKQVQVNKLREHKKRQEFLLTWLLNILRRRRDRHLQECQLPGQHPIKPSSEASPINAM